jgi:hypothetical protein
MTSRPLAGEDVSKWPLAFRAVTLDPKAIATGPVLCVDTSALVKPALEFSPTGLVASALEPQGLRLSRGPLYRVRLEHSEHV